VSVSSKLVGQNYQIINELGQVVLQGKIENTNLNLEVFALNHGFYFFNIDNLTNCNSRFLKL
jgi:hypothetical protein